MKQTLLLLLSLIIPIALAAQEKLVLQEQDGKYVIFYGGESLMECDDCDTVIQLSYQFDEHFIIAKNGAYGLVRLNDAKDGFNVLSDGDHYRMFETKWRSEPVVFATNYFGDDQQYHLGESWENRSDRTGKFRVGRNNLGKRAVCTFDKNLTPYTYDYLNNYYNGTFSTRIDGRSGLINTKGENLLEDDVDDIFLSRQYDSVYVLRDGKKWGIFSLNGSFNMPMREIKNPYRTFEIDDGSYSGLKQQYIITVDGKEGVMDHTGKVLLECLYDNVHPAYFSSEDAQLEASSRYVVKLNDKWTFLNEKFKEIGEVNGGQWLGVHRGLGLFGRGDKVEVVNRKTFLPEEFTFGSDDEYYERIFGEIGAGVVNRKGDVIVPFEYDWITVSQVDETMYYAFARKGDYMDMYGINGKLISDKEYYDISTACFGEDSFFEVSKEKDGLKGLGYYNIELQKFVIMVPFKFQYISCHSTEEDKPIATGKYPDGARVHIYRDGRLEEIED